MVVTYRAAGTAVLNAGTGNEASVGFPAGHVLNDILVLVVWHCDNVVCSVDQSYTNKVATNGGTTARLEVWWKRDNGSETAPTVTHAAGNSGVAQLFAFSGCRQTGDPFSASGSQGNSGTLTITAPTISPNKNDMVLFASVAGNNSGTSGSAQGIASYATTDPTSWTERSDQKNEAGTNDVNGSLATGLFKGAAAGTGAGTATEGWSYAAAATTNVGALLSLTAEKSSIQLNSLRPAIFKPGFSSWR